MHKANDELSYDISKHYILLYLTHCGLVIPYSHIDMGQYWLK